MEILIVSVMFIWLFFIMLSLHDGIIKRLDILSKKFDILFNMITTHSDHLKSKCMDEYREIKKEENL